MGTRDWQKIETIIDTVLELPKEQRQTYIDEQCKGNKQLKSEVTLLLESIFDSEGWLDNPGTFKEGFYSDISEHRLPHSSPDALIDKQIGSYILKELIGEGGMGTVYRAERTGDGFDHQVAIKIIRHERATEKNIRRFEHEQRILAGLNHPGIAKFFDGGITEEGFPYIIMEYVSGIPIDEYCQTQNYLVDEKLSLFKQVLEAVRYAHENLIIHRDLKPGNILVDESGSIKILDFGISKLLAQDESQDLTQTGARLLTPRYAAPEQIKQQNITTSIDLYALGLILFRLLTEAYPFSLDNQNQYETEQTILNTEPVKPSSAVDSKQLQKTLSGDLDAIILKALRKEPEKRYRVASEFLDDLDDYEQGIPVGAHADSMSYRTDKFFKRHKQGVAIAAGILLLLIGLTGFYTWRVAQERDMAQLEATKSAAVSSFLVDIFDSSNPIMENYAGNEIKAREVLTAGIKKADTELAQQPLIYIELVSSIGDALGNLDAHSEAQEALSKALAKSKEHYGPESIQTADILSMLTRSVLANSLPDAENYILEALDIIKAYTNQYQSKHAYYLSIYAEIKSHKSEYKVAEKLYLRADSLYKISNTSNNPGHFVTLDNLGEVQTRLAKYTEAEINLLKALDFYQEYYAGPHVNLAGTQHSLATLYRFMGEYSKSNKLISKAIDTQTELTGKNSAYLIESYGLLALNHIRLNAFDKALRYATEALEIASSVFSNNSIQYARRLNTIGLIHQKEGRYEKAMTNYLKAIEIKENILPPNHASLAVAYYNYAKVLKNLNLFEESKQYFEQALKIDQKKLGPTNPGVAIDMNGLASVLTELGAYQQADSLFKKAQEIYNSKLPENHYRKGENLLEQAKLDIKRADTQKAIKKLTTAKTVYLENFNAEHNKVKEIEQLLATIE